MKIRTGFIAAGLLITVTAFQNCKIADLVLSGEPVTRIFYESGGGYPPPNSPSPFESLELVRQSDGAIYGHRKTSHGCDVKGKVAAAEFDDLGNLIVKSAVRIGTSQMADGGTTTVQMERRSFAQRYHLRDDDTSYAQEILVDGQFVQAKVRKIADSLFCPPPPPVLASVLYRKEVSSATVIPFSRISEDIKLDVSFQSPLGQTLSGHIVVTDYRVSPATYCATKFDREPLDVDLTKAANMMSVFYSDVVCAMAQLDGDGPAPYMTLTNVSGRSETGYFSCLYGNRMQNTDAYLKNLDLWLQKHDRGSAYPVLI